jgi:hypothetical protein
MARNDRGAAHLTNRPVYVVRGGRSPCVPAGPTGANAGPWTCEGTLIVDALTAELLMTNERGASSDTGTL